MSILIIVIFVFGYLLISLENPLKIDKAATALLMGVVCWLVLLFGIEQMPAFIDSVTPHSDDHSLISESLFEHFGAIAEILFFLLGAMTIVELIDVHNGFSVITNRITTTNQVKLLWIISWISFFLSPVLDNLTTAVIMCVMLRRIIKDKHQQWLFGGFVIIAANSGGAWSPIGDVTSIMLWIGGQVTSVNLILSTFPASFISLLVPLILASYFLSGNQGSIERETEPLQKYETGTTLFERNLFFMLGSAALLFVPVFKAITHLPPYMGMLFSVGLVWYAAVIIHWKKEDEVRQRLSVSYVLHKIDTPTILFFLGILLAVASLDTSGHLLVMAGWLDTQIGDIYLINTLIGLISAVVDNVPLVAACMGMYDLSVFGQDHEFWTLLAYCAGTGGSILLIGSAAGVAAMGLLRIDFLGYFKRISLSALVGYASGILVYYLQHRI